MKGDKEVAEHLNIVKQTNRLPLINIFYIQNV